ncbi:hypothetical protein Rhopal_000922-T1 [Rhodotorula paludigena]|uniref:Mediator of RNA polymerase II transcription subunit 17 n=1 Tax=Rhodotorula paludigena TaxID=86838 RepID=A0AAV5GFV3_9BASI|nr:hypothetical protein Rhopal_000922-T1 [Rhodotorula paludigena]
MATTTQLSLEPVRPVAGDGLDSDLFARPARLHDVVLEDGREVFTREDPKKSLAERLQRVWAERGDFSLLTADSIRNPDSDDTSKQDGEDADEDARPSVEDMRALQETMIHSLALARGELTTALDLLSVLSPPRDPPDVDVNAIPLPQQTLTFVPTAPPPIASSDPSTNPLAALPLASTLSALKSSANAFFRARTCRRRGRSLQRDLLTLEAPSAHARAPDPWPTILRLHASSARTLVPLGAGKGASLSGKGEARLAREVGVFFGAHEARPEFRRAAVARVGELLGEGVERRTGRKLVVQFEAGETRETVVWGPETVREGAGEEEKVEAVLQARAKSAFAEELFAQLTREARADGSLQAQLQLGSRTEGDTIHMTGRGWTLRLTMTTASPAVSATARIAGPVAAILRLLFVQEYAMRRSSSKSDKPILATVSAYLSYSRRVSSLSALLDRLRAHVEEQGVEAKVEHGREERGEADELLKVLEGGSVLGGRATLRVGKSRVYNILHTYPLPSSSPSPAAAIFGAPQPTLTLRMPGKAPVAVPSLVQLETFLSEQVMVACRAERAQRENGVNGGHEDEREQ